MWPSAVGDGLNLLLVQAGYASNASLYKSNTFDPVKDLTPVSLLASGPLVLTVNVNLPVKSERIDCSGQSKAWRDQLWISRNRLLAPFGT
jgi:hypothetical protein